MQMINNLEDNAAEIHRVGGGEENVFLLQFLPKSIGTQQAFECALRIIEIALDADDFQVVSIFGHHLQALHIGGAAVGVHAGNPNIGAVFKGVECCRACVTGGGSKNQVLLVALLRNRR